MGWAKYYFKYDIDSIKDKNTRGYSYKLCPYSTAYREKFKYTGTLYTAIVAGETVSKTGTFVIGNSTDQSLWGLDYATYVCSEHITTSGNMVQVSNPPGWICDDPVCYYYTNISVGDFYREV